MTDTEYGHPLTVGLASRWHVGTHAVCALVISTANCSTGIATDWPWQAALYEVLEAALENFNTQHGIAYAAWTKARPRPSR